MDFFESIKKQATETISKLNLVEGTQGYVNAYFEAQRSQFVPLVTKVPDPAVVATQPTAIQPSSTTPVVSMSPLNIQAMLPILALVGFGAFFLFRGK